jgi:predicted CoA-substrate-specific enzyme activase
VKLCAIDVGSTTCKYVLSSEAGGVEAQDYQRHGGRPAEKVLEFLGDLEGSHGLRPGHDRIFFTGSGCGYIAPLVGGRIVQEVVAVATAVEVYHPAVHFVSEIGGEDMKTVFFADSGTTRTKQVLMQSSCSGGTGAFIEKTARKLQIPLQQLSQMGYDGRALHKISSKCGIFAETDANTLLKAGVAVEEIIASLFDAVVYQNLATLTKGSTPLPEVLLLGGPNLFFTGLQQAWRHHLTTLWKEREIALPAGREPTDLITVPEQALYYAALGCIEVGRTEPSEAGVYCGQERLASWVAEGQYAQKLKDGRPGLCASREEFEAFRARYAPSIRAPQGKLQADEKVVIGCDFGSVTAKAVCLSPQREVLFACYALSKGNPIEDAKGLFRQLEAAVGNNAVAALAVTGYGKDLLKDIVGADSAPVETVAHATAGLHWFPDADCICDVGGTDVKIMILRNGTVSDFRLNSQCSSGNGAFLQNLGERFNIPLADMAEHAFAATAMPRLLMGCGVFLQSDIINQQRKGWQPDEILAGLCAVLPLNVWVYAGGLSNLSQVGKKFILQGGTHRNLAVVKAQINFIQSKIPDAEIVVHPYPGEAGAIGAALVALAAMEETGQSSRFRGFTVIEHLNYRTTTAPDTRCSWCENHCQRTFIDVELPGAKGRPWSKLPLAEGWERIIVNNSCPKGLIEDVHEIRAVKDEIDRTRDAYPNLAQLVQSQAFRCHSD